MQWIRLTPVVLMVIGASCEKGTCPTIGCYPKITMHFANAVPAQYRLSVAVIGRTYEASCPSSNFGVTEGIDTCSSSEFELVGVDLGHADVSNLPVSISIDGLPQIAAKANLTGIQNSKECDLICYTHEGVVNN
jgi:hypothetical protein